MGFRSARWSFFESGHGNGVPDAFKGSIKREVDKKVMYEANITSAQTFVDKMKNGKTKVLLVTEDEIETVYVRLEQNILKPINGTLKLHQVIADIPGTVFYRDLSCICHSSCDLCNQVLKQAHLLNSKGKKKETKYR